MGTMMFSSMPDASWLKLVQRPPLYRTGLPDFVDMGSTRDPLWNCASELEVLREFVQSYDYRNSKEITEEDGFRRSVRILPAMPIILGDTQEDIPVPYGGYPYNKDPLLVNTCAELINKLLPQFYKVTKTMWICTSIQLTGMQPGVLLKPHIDGYWPHRLAEKIHLPLTTNERCRQLVFDNDTANVCSMYHLKPGGIYAINNLEPHSAFNFGSDVRWHVIVDLFEYDAWVALKEEKNRDWPEHSSPYSVNPQDAVDANAVFVEKFLSVHGTLEPRRYAHSLLSGAPYYNRQNERVVYESGSSKH